MAKPDLHSFERDLANKPGNGSAAPPRTIRAKDLDGNFKKVSLREDSNTQKPAYTVEYTADGTRLKIKAGLPEGAEFKEFDVCENGQPVKYWLATWDEDPSET